MFAPRQRRPLGAALALAMLSMSQPLSAADFQLDNVRMEFGLVTLSAPKLEVKGSPLEREAFRSLLDIKSGETALARIDRLSAAEIRAPELVVEVAQGKQKQVTTYRDVRFSDIRDGQLARGESAGGSLAGQNPDGGKLSGTLLAMRFEGLDMRQTARVLVDRVPAGQTEPVRPLLRRAEQDGYSIDMGPAGKISFGRATSRDMAAGVGPEPLGDLLTRAMALSEQTAAGGASKDDPVRREAEKRMGIALLGFYDRVEIGSGEIRDMVMTVVDAKAAKPGAKPDPVEISIARIAYGQDAPAKSGFALEGLRFAGGGARGMVDSISYVGFSYGPVVKALLEDLGRPGSGPDMSDWRRYVPTLGTMSLVGLTFDAPPAARGATPVKVGIGTFEMKAGEQLNGIPTSLSLTLDRLVAPITEGAGNPAAQGPDRHGYPVAQTCRPGSTWPGRPRANELAIRQIALGGAGLARLEASATLGNVTKDLFSNDAALAQVAALGATARGLTAKLENFGLVEKLIANEARKAGRKPDEMRQQFAMIASLGLASILGPSDAAKTLTAAVSRFVAKPGTLTLDARAKSASGLGLADVITITDPTEILDKIELKADAQ